MRFTTRFHRRFKRFNGGWRDSSSEQPFGLNSMMRYNRQVEIFGYFDILILLIILSPVAYLNLNQKGRGLVLELEIESYEALLNQKKKSAKVYAI